MRYLNYISLVILTVLLFPATCMHRIDPGKVGVRRSLEGGVAEQDFPVGYHWSVPFLHKWYSIDNTLHYLEYLTDNQTSLDVRTRDANTIYIDLIIPYRIRNDEAWKIVREGFADTLEVKIKSTATGILRDAFAGLSSLDVQKYEERQRTAAAALEPLNAQLAQYHVRATHVVISAIRFRDAYEKQLQQKQLLEVQGLLAEAEQRSSAARQETETMEKIVLKDLGIKREEWNKKIEELRAKYDLEIGAIEAEATRYGRNRKADADALYATMKAEGDLAEALADAVGEKLKADVLASRSGRIFVAIEAARRFKLGDIQLNSNDPRFLRQFADLGAWQRFFLGE